MDLIVILMVIYSCILVFNFCLGFSDSRYTREDLKVKHIIFFTYFMGRYTAKILDMKI